MPTTITVKNIPDVVYEKLQASAQTHHRSLNSELIDCLERSLLPRRLSPDERLARARRLRADLNGRRVSPREITRARRSGRP